MRILHIGKYFPPYAGGIENFLGDLCPALERLGVTVGVLAHEERGRIQPVNDIHHKPTYLKLVPAHGQLLYAPISPKFAGAMAKSIEQFKPDLIHFHMPNTSAFWGLILPRARKIPWIIHWHADVVASKISPRMALAYKFYRPFEQLMLKRATAIIATSDRYLQRSEALEKWQNKCTVVPLGLDPARITFHNQEKQPLWSGKDSFKLLSIGRLTYYKGHESLIRAVAEIDNVEAIIVGQGENYEKLQKLITALGVDQRIKLAGGLSNESLYSTLQQADCLCLASEERTEAFGLVLLEAMCYSKPVIATDIPGSGIGWVVDNGITGILVQPGQPTALAESIKYLADNPKIAIRMGISGQQRYQKQFHIDKVADKIQQTYQAVLNHFPEPLS